MIQALISDLGGVLLDFNNSIYESRFLISSRCEPAELRAALDELLSALHVGDITPEEFHEGMVARAGLNLSFKQTCLVYGNIFTVKTGTVSLLQRLRPKVRLCLLSNTNAIHWEWCRSNYPFLDLFEHHVLSHEVRRAKPDPTIYHRALELLNLPPEACVFFDDYPEYAAAASDLGIHGLTFTTAAKLEDDLARLGVSV